MDTMTPAAQIIISLIPIVGIAFAATLIFFVFLWKHLENTRRIEKDTYVPPVFNYKVIFLLTGLCLVGVGLVLTVMFLLLEPFSWATIGGLIPLILGIMVLIFYKINPDYKHDDEK